jgi:hypothetical protein
VAVSEGQSGFFGQRWDAAIVDEAVPVPTPVGELCMYCREAVQEGDQGTINAGGWIGHRECGLRNVLGGIGHLVDHLRYCKGDLGPDAGLTRRQSALLVWERFTLGRVFTCEQIDRMREEQT